MRTILKLILGLALYFSSHAQAESKTIKIAVAGPHTGPYAAFGEQMLKGAEKAAQNINKAGGVLGKTLEIVKVDDECKPMGAVNAANEIVSKYKANAVVGHFCSASTIPASKTYMSHNVIMVTPASTNPKVTERKLPNVLRMCGRDDQQGQVAARFISQDLKAKTVAIVHDKTTYGRGLADAMKESLSKVAPMVKEALFEGITRGDKDFNTLVTKIKAKQADVVYFGGLHSEAGPLLKQMRQQGLKAHFVSGDGIVSNDFVTAAGGSQFVDGVYVTFGRDPLKYDTTKNVVASFKQDGYKPEGYTLYAYASVEAIVAAMQSTKSTKGVALANWLKTNGSNTIMGPKKWDKLGDLTKSDYVIYRWDDKGNYNEI
ncbi:branched-chain amino acid ABC transporter substrate-binding protein [Pseudobacteriovorax antillogorgiicola]|uniref:Amino acid/amide ABC transporter substrate-binding protein, HAAT family n=1 Tax=Pseudobacteriovorax antillogorgiicola TaxID=1513793 RepID=A0A1Y6CUK5_9BACT|nr:branched-chain amino acid ABC transporter substrate-binding protein [Pseudobacteriovorax antillogorgiicola]TCS44420.1 amino acid/amide ABC transporter substrate-binding protein (HAAT family) [Pseudobacteriovorax antillogorgiicola]SMF79081.1 amino acid/amide ABC transporter substrate-binding protein, HAAT family [Pseudobacteriovorax antillogorgiicola]